MDISTRGSGGKDTPTSYGAGVDISLPISTPLSLDEWFNQHMQEADKAGLYVNPVSSKTQFANQSAFKVYHCTLGCRNDYSIKYKGQIYQIDVFVGGNDKEKLQPIMDKIVSSFKFLD